MSEKNVEIVRRCYAALDQRDWDGLWRQAHPYFELRTQMHSSYRGPHMAQKFIEDQFEAFESWEAVPGELFEGDDLVVAFVTVRANPRGTDAQIEIKIGHVWTFRDGQVWALEMFPQREKALEAAGLAE